MRYKQLKREWFSPLVAWLCVLIWMGLGISTVIFLIYFLMCFGGKI